jgi:hypothetical protein
MWLECMHRFQPAAAQHCEHWPVALLGRHMQSCDQRDEDTAEHEVPFEMLHMELLLKAASRPMLASGCSEGAWHKG